MQDYDRADLSCVCSLSGRAALLYGNNGSFGVRRLDAAFGFVGKMVSKICFLVSDCRTLFAGNDFEFEPALC